MTERPWKYQVSLVVFGLVLWIPLLIVWAAIQNHAEFSARSALLGELSQLKNASHVRVNSRELSEPGPLVVSLRRLNTVRAHHSHPTTPIHVEIRDGVRTVVCVIARDSERQDEYWVFRPDKG
jgi:hypothetical protein